MIVKAPLVSVLVGVLLWGCAEESALSVSDVSFNRADLLGLSDSQTELLSMITAIGLAAARGEVARVGGPVNDRRRDELRVERLRQEVALDRAGVTDRVLEARYAQNPEFELTVRHLVTLSERWRSPEQRAEARARTEAALGRARAGEPFPELAGEVSEEPGAEVRGGLLEPGRAGSWVDEFWEGAARLQVGEISDVVETEYGFHVLRLDHREPVPFPEARARVVAEVAAELDSPEAWQLQVARWTDGLSTMSRASSVEEIDERVRELLIAEADRRNLSVSEPDEARIIRAWESRMAGWAAALGFEPEMTPGEIGDQSLIVLGSTGQNARIARDEILESREALLAAYPITTAGP